MVNLTYGFECFVLSADRRLAPVISVGFPFVKRLLVTGHVSARFSTCRMVPIIFDFDWTGPAVGDITACAPLASRARLGI